MSRRAPGRPRGGKNRFGHSAGRPPKPVVRDNTQTVLHQFFPAAPPPGVDQAAPAPAPAQSTHHTGASDGDSDQHMSGEEAGESESEKWTDEGDDVDDRMSDVEYDSLVSDHLSHALGFCWGIHCTLG